MNLNVCVVTIFFLSFQIVAGITCLSSWPETPRQQQQPSLRKPENQQVFSPKLCHQWYQGYQNGIPQIAKGNVLPQRWVETTRLIIKVEEFDNNTVIYCENSSKNKQITKEKTTHAWNTVTAKINSYLDFVSKKYVDKTFIQIEDNETSKENEKPTILNYNEKQNVSFSCLEHINNKTTYIQLGLINTTSNVITLVEADSTHKIFNKTHSGTILCCVYYVVKETAEEKWITRFVGNKTLLRYNDIVGQVSLEAQEIILSNSTSTDSAAEGHQTIIIITITAVALVFILLAIIIICKKRCRKKPVSDAKVLYADLDILRQNEPDNIPRPGPKEESPYAQIIGEIRPQSK